MEYFIGDIKALKVAINKIIKYNMILEELKQNLGIDLSELSKSLEESLDMERKSIEDRTKEENYFLNRLDRVIEISYYGWFEKICDHKTLYENVLKYNSEEKMSYQLDTDTRIGIYPISTFSGIDLRRITHNDYKTELGSCYKSGNLNLFRYLNLVIKIIEKKINKIEAFIQSLEVDRNNFIKEHDKLLDTSKEIENGNHHMLRNKNYEERLYIENNLLKAIISGYGSLNRNIYANSLLKNQSLTDLKLFIEHLQKLFLFKRRFFISQMGKIDKIKCSDKLSSCFNELEDTILTSEELLLLRKMLTSDMAFEIENCINNYRVININEIPKKYVLS